MLRGVKFGSYHTGKDWNMILNEKSFPPPTPKTLYVKVDGRDGDLDLSEGLTGEVKFENRQAVYKFIMTKGTYKDREKTYIEILKVVHGRSHKIMIDDDEDHFLYGRCKVKDFENNNAYATLTIEANCEPWRYYVIRTVRSIAVDGVPVELSCVNTGVRTAIPELIVTGSITISFGDVNVALSDGTYKVPELRFKSGVNILTARGSGELTVTYQEAIL